MKILIVEDELIIAKVFEKLLKNIGHEVVLFGSGERALEKVTEFVTIDLIIMDVQLKGELNGFDTAKNMRKTINCPIIFTTGNQKSSAEAEASQITNSHILIKPVNFEDILTLINQINKS